MGSGFARERGCSLTPAGCDGRCRRSGTAYGQFEARGDRVCSTTALAPAAERAAVVGCRAGAGDGGAKRVPARAMVLRMVSGLCATAVSATLRGFPLKPLARGGLLGVGRDGSGDLLVEPRDAPPYDKALLVADREDRGEDMRDVRTEGADEVHDRRSKRESSTAYAERWCAACSTRVACDRRRGRSLMRSCRCTHASARRARRSTPVFGRSLA